MKDKTKEIIEIIGQTHRTPIEQSNDILSLFGVIGCSYTNLELQIDIGDFKKGEIKTDAEWCEITKRNCSNLPLIGDSVFKINTL